MRRAEGNITECSKLVFGVLVSLGVTRGFKEVKAGIRGFKVELGST
jgi:hypothetical protein